MLKHVYIVDDDEPLRISLQLLLSTQPDLLISSYKSGDDFLADADEAAPGIVLLDVHMPGSSGMDVLAEIQRRDLRLVSIIITGQGNTAMAVKAMKLGAVDFIEKPYDHMSLLETVERGFDRVEQVHAEAARVAAAHESIARLSPRELDVLMGLIAGRANKVIAFELDISPRTVEIYRANLMAKLQVRSLSEALRIAFAAGLLL